MSSNLKFKRVYKYNLREFINITNKIENRCRLIIILLRIYLL